MILIFLYVCEFSTAVNKKQIFIRVLCSYCCMYYYIIFLVPLYIYKK